jgi:excinuclease ABC subunit B
MADFHLESPHHPKGDQPKAIAELSDGLARGDRIQVLLGATGTGKTFTVAHVIAAHGRPTLVMSHNKTLAAQLYGELKALFPSNSVEYFVSYYDYYQPEAYLPATDTYIEKDASINEDIERLRLRATSALMEREDVIIVASVSSIYGLGNPRDYRELMLHLTVGEEKGRREILKGLVAIQYRRNDYLFERGTFRVRGDTVEIFPAYEEQGIRVELWGDEVERITRFDPLTGEIITNLERTAIYPASHYVTRRSTVEEMVPSIREELKHQVSRFRENGQLLEAQRIEQRTNFDVEMMLETGTCQGIENYSVPCLRSPDQWDVPGGSKPEAGAGRAWVSPSQRAGQPAPEVRGMGRPIGSGDIRKRYTGGLGAGAGRGGRGGADHPTHGSGGS